MAPEGTATLSRLYNRAASHLTPPLGVQRKEDATLFRFFSTSREVVLLLFLPEEKTPFLRAKMKQKGNYHTLEVADLPDVFDYLYLCGQTTCIDPYAPCLTSHPIWGQPQEQLRGRFLIEAPFDWGDDAKPLIPAENLILYEMHVRSLTADPSSGVSFPGTFEAVIEKIPYLMQLGVNAVELMPIFEFDECSHTPLSPDTGHPLVNYWGYDPVHFFSPMRRYTSPKNSASTAFKNLVKALHSAGIEVILDVVYNHTGKSASILHGPDAAVYYRMEKERHCNDSGCGHTFNCQHPVVQTLILDSLRHWVTHYRVDGFRFDLASILTRDEKGMLMNKPPLLEKIARDPLLAPARMIAEPWDAGGAYQVGAFPSWRFAEWNGKYRDTVRQFICGDGAREAFKKRVLGSPDLYPNASPARSINYICAHDGFTLRDLVSFNRKHNEANGEANKDGSNDNISWNCGVEGATDNLAILRLRSKQQRNLALALFVSLGTPMWLMGDERGHTRGGNNNAWCQDNSCNHLSWSEDTLDKNFFRFVSALIAFRKNSLIFGQKTFFSASAINWYEQPGSPLLAWSIQEKLLIAFNPSPQKVDWELPLADLSWSRFIDTDKPPPDDVSLSPLPLSSPHYTLNPYSSVLLINN